MSESESENNENIELEAAWKIGCSAVIPEKSKNRYQNTYDKFTQWCDKKKLNDFNEKVLLAYFVYRKENLKSPGSLWSEYSMLKCTIFLNNSIDISKYATLIAFLKRKTSGWKPKKSKIFTKEDLFKFLTEAPDNEYLIQKVAMIFGIAGACRREELYNIRITDIEDQGLLIIVKVPFTKTNTSRCFTVTNSKDEIIDYLEIYRKYARLRPKNAASDRFFMKFSNGKCHNQVVGRNTIGSWPSKVAKYLNLKDSSLYTGHAFRRSSATLLANKGTEVLGLKRHGGWQSTKVAESYVEDSLQNKIEFAEKILHDDSYKNIREVHQSTSNSTDISTNISSPPTVPSTSSASCLTNSNYNTSNVPIIYDNCTFHININKQ